MITGILPVEERCKRPCRWAGDQCYHFNGSDDTPHPDKGFPFSCRMGNSGIILRMFGNPHDITCVHNITKSELEKVMHFANEGRFTIERWIYLNDGPRHLGVTDTATYVDGTCVDKPNPLTIQPKKPHFDGIDDYIHTHEPNAPTTIQISKDISITITKHSG